MNLFQSIFILFFPSKIFLPNIENKNNNKIKNSSQKDENEIQLQLPLFEDKNPIIQNITTLQKIRKIRNQIEIDLSNKVNFRFFFFFFFQKKNSI